MQAPMDLESKQQDAEPGAAVAGAGAPNSVDLSRWDTQLAMQMQEYDAEAAEGEVMLPEVESISKARLARVILPSGTVILCSGTVLLRHCHAVKPFAEQLTTHAVHLDFNPKNLFPDEALIAFFSRLHQYNLKEDEPLSRSLDWEPEWCYVVRVLNMSGLFAEAQKGLNKRFERGERVYDWIRLLRQTTPDDRKFRDEVINAFTGLSMPLFQKQISDENFDNAFSILDTEDLLYLANSKWIYRFDLPASATERPVDDSSDGLPMFKFPNMQYKAIRIQPDSNFSTEKRHVVVEAAANLSAAEQVTIEVSPVLTIVGSAAVLKQHSRVVESLAEGAVLPLDGANHMKEPHVIEFFEMLHKDDTLSGVDDASWRICWVVLADLLQVEALYERLSQWVWGLKEILVGKDFWHWVAASRLPTVQRYRPDDAPSTATKEDVFAILEKYPRARLQQAVVVQRELFLQELTVMHVVRLLQILA